MSVIPQTAWIRALLVVMGMIVVFAVARTLAVPATFGQYGYYRGASVDEWAARPTSYSAGPAKCQSCHAQVYAQWSGGAHGFINCETCHGAAGPHASGADQRPARPKGREFCGSCHASDKARPDLVKQVNVSMHSSNLECTACHRPHDPVLPGGRDNL